MFNNKIDLGSISISKTGYGPSVERFEKEFGVFTGKIFNISCSSATAAADMIFAWLSKRGKLIRTTSLGFCSPVIKALKNGFSIHIDDIDDNLLLSDWYAEGLYPDLYVTYGGSGNETNAIVVDAAHNPLYQNKNAEFIFYSFYPTKPIKMLNGGLIATDNAEAALFFLEYRNFGRKNSGLTYIVESMGDKYYMDQFNAELGLRQLDNLHQDVAIRNNNYLNYKELSDLGLGRLVKHCGRSSYYFASFIFEKEIAKLVRNTLHMEYGITLPFHYPLIHKQPAFENHVKVISSKNADLLENRLLNLPLDNIDLVIRTISAIKKVCNV